MPDKSTTAPATTALQQAVMLHQQGLLSQARAIYERILASEPANVDALHLLGVIAGQEGQFELALSLLDQAVSADPGNPVAHANRGGALKELKRLDEALASYDRALAIRDDYADAYFNRAIVLKALRRWDEALASYDQALVHRPRWREANYNRALLLAELRQWPAALAGFDSAIAAGPGHAESHANRGNVLRELGLWEAALASYQRAIAINPQSAEAYANRAYLHRDLKQYPAAIASFDDALRIKPDFALLPGQRWHAKRQIADWSGPDEDAAGLVNGISTGQSVVTPFNSLALTHCASTQRRVAELWARHQGRSTQAVPPLTPHRPAARIRIGYFSADFHLHATMILMAELFELHDRSAFDITAFSFGTGPHDEMRRRLDSACEHVIDVRAQSDRQVAMLARARQIDIAVDLKGYTEGNRAGIFASRAAPLQVSYLGYPGTTGADYMDYLIADSALIPPESRRHYTEKIVYLPHSYQVNDRKRRAAGHAGTRATFGLPDRGFVYASFNNTYKISPTVFSTWMRILKRVDGSVVWLLQESEAAAANLRREAARRGIEPHRLVFAPRVEPSEHLARHHAADLFLDTLPYNAHTTASDALWSGLPVLTLMGDALASRVAASLLYALDLPELVTATPAAYEAMAVQLAERPTLLAEYRRRLVANRHTSPLFDAPRFTRHLETAYTMIHDRYRAGLPPDHLVVARSVAPADTQDRPEPPVARAGQDNGH